MAQLGRTPLRWAVLTAPLVVALLAACGGDEGGADDAVADATASTAPPVSEVEVEPSPLDDLLRLELPDDAAQSLYDSWAAGDRGTAELAASPPAVEALFSSDLDPASWVLEGCAAMECTFATDDGPVRFTVAPTSTGSHLVLAIDLGA